MPILAPQLGNGAVPSSLHCLSLLMGAFIPARGPSGHRWAMGVGQELCSCSTRGCADVQAGLWLQLCPGLWCLWPGRSPGNSFAARGVGGSRHPAHGSHSSGDEGAEPWEVFPCPSRQVCARFSTPNCRRFPSQEAHESSSCMLITAGLAAREFPRGSGRV